MEGSRNIKGLVLNSKFEVLLPIGLVLSLSYLWTVGCMAYMKCFIASQMVLNGEAQCFRQIVTVSNSDGRVIACEKPRMVGLLYESTSTSIC